ncbi:MAG TPA: NUDIX domain-containing protein [Opitutaceae bacterium]|nr:NUDIX domain-containing protein [Opitutaceae bacterium]
MSEEFFDLVDERDAVIGRAPRREVHARKLRHRAIHVLVFDPAGRVFLQKRSMTKDSSPGLWDSSCSGHVDSGEDYDAAARRELGEEIGVHLAAPPARWFRIEACAQTGWEFVWVYRLAYGGPFVLHPEEIERGEWFEPADLARQLAARPAIFAAPFRLIWGLAVEKMKPGAPPS